jgi:hypothetical protein
MVLDTITAGTPRRALVDGAQEEGLRAAAARACDADARGVDLGRLASQSSAASEFHVLQAEMALAPQDRLQVHEVALVAELVELAEPTMS